MKKLLLIALLTTALGCDGDSGSGPDRSVTVLLRDSPFTDAKAVLVTFSEVSAHRTGGPFETIPLAGGATSRTCDLKRLVGATDVLGVGTLPEGHYTQIRLLVTSATLNFDSASSGPACGATAPSSGRTAPVEIPSGEVKLNREFEVGASGATIITLDFDGDRSIRETGNGRYVMSPVISVVSVE